MLSPDTLLQNRYRVIRRIGQGGMGAVYEARHEELGHVVALKEAFHSDAESLRKAFKREARLLASLSHPALPKVTDYFTEGDGLFLVMEYVHGVDLAELLKQRGGTLTMEYTLRLARQLLEVLRYLHTYDPPVIHRDIKPSNIKLDERDRIVLVDFGLAKGAAADASSSVVTTQSVLGFTLTYSPLEQILKVDPNLSEHLSVVNAEKVRRILGTSTDQRSDLYSVGATLYHLLTGKIPVQAPTRALAVWSGWPDPLAEAHLVNQEIPRSVSDIVREAMAIESDGRPRTAAEMSKALLDAHAAPAVAGENDSPPTTLPPTVVDSSVTVKRLPTPQPLITSEPIAPSPSARPSNEPAPADGAVVGRSRARRLLPLPTGVRALPLYGILALMALGMLFFLTSRRGASPGEVANRETPSPTGAAAAGAQATPQAAVSRKWSVSQVLTAHEKPVAAVAFAPDGRTLVSGSADGAIKVWEVSSGRVLRTIQLPTYQVSGGYVCETKSEDYQPTDNTIRHLTFLPDGSLASTSDDGSVRFWDVQSARMLRAITLPVLKTEEEGCEQGETYISRAPNRINSLSFTSDGKTLATGSMDKFIRIWDVESGRLVTTVETDGEKVSTVALSPDGKVLASSGDGGVLRVWDLPTKELQKRLADHTKRVLALVFSPDGGTLASGGLDGNLRLWDVATGRLLKTMRGQNEGLLPTPQPPGNSSGTGNSNRDPNDQPGKYIKQIFFSTDGKLVATVAWYTVALWDVEAGDLKQLLQDGTTDVTTAALTRDGNMLASATQSKVKIWESK